MIMSIETMLGATVEELRSIAGDESLSGAYKDSLYASADWVVAAIDRIAELEKDAARYRWLRDCMCSRSSKEIDRAVNALSRGEWWEDKDDHIDTAMQKD